MQPFDDSFNCFVLFSVLVREVRVLHMLNYIPRPQNIFVRAANPPQINGELTSTLVSAT